MNSNAAVNMIAKVDLDPIKVKLMDKESGEGWSLAQTNAVEFEYRRFLCLMKLFPQEQAAPLFDVDVFWHYHILDTMKYAEDCEQIFGYFLHHFPYVGLRGENDKVMLEEFGVRMQQLYETTFGEAYFRQEEPESLSALTEYAGTAAQNDPAYSVRLALGMGKTAYCVSPPMSAANTAYCVSPPMASARTAYCVSPPMGAAKTAYCVSPPIAATKTAYCVSPPVGAVKMAYCVSPPLSAANNTACRTSPSQNDAFYSARPTLAHAA